MARPPRDPSLLSWPWGSAPSGSGVRPPRSVSHLYPLLTLMLRVLRCLWQCLKVREGRRKGARAWQDHFIETLLSQDCPGSLSSRVLKSPTIFYSSDFEAALDLHVDDGYMTGPAGVGDSFEHVGALRVTDNEGMWVKELDKYETPLLTMMQMKDCRPSTSPKLEKQTEPGDDDPCEHPELYRSAVCTILYMTKRGPNLQATTRWMCKRLRNPNKKSWRAIGQKL